MSRGRGSRSPDPELSIPAPELSILALRTHTQGPSQRLGLQGCETGLLDFAALGVGEGWVRGSRAWINLAKLRDILAGLRLCETGLRDFPCIPLAFFRIPLHSARIAFAFPCIPRAIPSHSPRIPLHSRAFPSHSPAFPSRSPAFPSHSLAFPCIPSQNRPLKAKKINPENL